jgi:acetolactate synthase-1/2/3 large subunit
MTTVAEAVAAELYRAGVRVVFGLPGGETVELLDALRRRGIEFVLTHSESAAVFMADAHARVSGLPSAVLATLGPGAANAVVGAAHAFLDRSPVLIFTAQKPDALLPDYTHQVLDLQALYTPVTKASLKVTAGYAAQAVVDALAIARQGRPGPIHLQISNEDAAQTTFVARAEAVAPETSADRPAAIAAAQCLLETARRPLIVAGLGLEPQRPYAALAALAERLHAPVVVTPKAKGALPDNHPLAAGTIGLTRTDPVYALVGEADCLVAVGYDVVELVLPWNVTAPTLWVAPWPNVDPTIPAAIELVGDQDALLRSLCAAAPSVEATWGAARVRAFHAAQAAPVGNAAPHRVLPQDVLACLRRALPADSVLAVDVGSHKIFSSLSWPALKPNRFLVSNGLSSMGYGLPAAIGAALATPGRPVACLTGDAGLAMVLGELGVVAQLNLPVMVVVLNDGAIDLIRSHQVRAGKPVFGTEFLPPSFTQIATAYGIAAQRIEQAQDLPAALAWALDLNRPSLVEVMLDPVSYPTTPRT